MSLALTIAKSNNLYLNIQIYKYKLNKDNNKKFENIKNKSIFQKLKMIRVK